MNIIDSAVWLLGLVANPIAAACKAISPSFFARMGNDFASWLFILSVFTGVLWTLDRFWLEKRRKLAAHGAEPAKASWLVDFGRQFFPVIVAVFVLRSFIVEPFRIPSGSMIPTLRVGDFILVNRFAYGLRCPVGDCTIAGSGLPERGDVAVFRYPVDPKMDFIKRIVGLPGDTIRYEGKQLSVNGKPALLTAKGDFEGGPVQLYGEDFMGVVHESLQNPDRPAQDFEFTVPEGQYFAMGDNRDGSSDSRYWGTVPASHLKGKAFFIWMSYDAEAPSLAGRIVTSRIGMGIR